MRKLQLILAKEGRLKEVEFTLGGVFAEPSRPPKEFAGRATSGR